MKIKKLNISDILILLITIALFVLIVFFEINPVKAVSDTYNTQRENGVETLLTAIEDYSLQNHGMLPPSIPAISSPLILNNISTSGIGSGFNINNNTQGIPNCIQAGAKENMCLNISMNTPIYFEIQKYLNKNLPQGDFYVAKNIYGTKVVVFSNDLGKGKSVDKKGFSVAYSEYNF